MLGRVEELIEGLKSNDQKSLARVLTIVENDLAETDDLLKLIKPKNIPVIGFTGPPGAGKSTLVNALINSYVKDGHKIAVLAIDPSSPFNKGSLLGDRIRMKDQFNDPNVFIRSVASRGYLGGISAKTIEMTDVVKAADFDYIFIETVGVGQSELEIAGLADITVVILVPESGDDIQHIKSGLMEIADVFVVNKSDREGSETFANKLKMMLSDHHQNIKIINTVADQSIGIEELKSAIDLEYTKRTDKRLFLLSEKAWSLIQNRKMKEIKKEVLQQKIAEALNDQFNLYVFIDDFMNS
jgi:LAO/AO transport system kinase